MPLPEPAQDLVAVKFLASTDCLRLGVGPAHDRLRVLFDGPGSQRQRRRFAKGIVALLSPSDFVRTTRDTVGPDDKPLEYDVYAIKVDVASLQSPGRDRRGWGVADDLVREAGDFHLGGTQGSSAFAALPREGCTPSRWNA